MNTVIDFYCRRYIRQRIMRIIYLISHKFNTLTLRQPNFPINAVFRLFSRKYYL